MQRLVSPDGDSPLFRQLERLLRRQIDSGELKPGDRIPSLAEFCKTHRVSAITVRRAINDLIREGLLTGVQGKGVYVATPKAASSTAEGLVGVIIPDLANTPFFSGVQQGVSAELAGHHLVVASSNLDPQVEIRLLQDYYRRGIRNILICPVSNERSSDEDAAIKELLAGGCHLICVDRHFGSIETDRATSDNKDIGRIAADHLISLGHTRLAFIYAHTSTTFSDRLSGIAEALQTAGLTLDPEMVRGGWSSSSHDYAEAGYLHTLELFHHPHPPTAIISGNDGLAYGALKALALMRTPVPGRVSVVGIDDLPGSAHTAPPLTTVRQDTAGMGRIAAKLLHERMNGQDDPPRERLVPGQLIVRSSTGRVP